MITNTKVGQIWRWWL